MVRQMTPAESLTLQKAVAGLVKAENEARGQRFEASAKLTAAAANAISRAAASR